MAFELFDVEIAMPALFYFTQPGEFDDPYYEVKTWHWENQEYEHAGYLVFSEGRWSFETDDVVYALDSCDLREIADKLDSLNGGV